MEVFLLFILNQYQLLIRNWHLRFFKYFYFCQQNYIPDKDLIALILCLEYSFADKNKNIKKFLGANFESIADRITDNL